MKKRSLSILLTLCMVFSLLPTVALAADVTNADYTFVASTGALTVKTNSGTTDWRQDTNIVGSGPSKNYTAVKFVTIDAAVTSIGQQAFKGCTELGAVTIPANVTTIGDSAFMGCSKLGEVTIPASVTIIKGDAFAGCTGLTSLTFGADSVLKTIDERAFSGCKKLAAITIPKSVTTIGGRAFYGCKGLTSLTFAPGTKLETIPSDAFYGCKMLAAVEIPASVVAIGKSAFEDCGGLTSLTFAAGSELKTIAQKAFLGCGSLTTLTLPTQLSYIDLDAFRGCTALTSVTFTSAKAPSMGRDIFAFSGGTKPTSGVTLTVPEQGNGYTEDTWAEHGYTGLFPKDKQDLTPPATPTVTFSFDGKNAGQLIGTTTKMEYMVLSYSVWKPCTAENTLLPRGDIEDINTEDGIQIRVASAGYTPSSASKIIPITQANPPTKLTKVDASGGTGGKINGTTTAMEYSLDNFATATPCMEGATTGLLPGYYSIRFKAHGTTQSSEAVTLQIKSIKINVDVPAPDPKTFNGAPLTCDVSETDDYTVTSNLDHIDAGSYPVVLTLKTPTTHKWASGSVSGTDGETITIQFIIEKAAAIDLANPPAIDFAAETVATTTDMQWYQNLSWVDCTAGMSPADFGWDGSTLLQVTFRAKNDNNYNASTQEQPLSLPARPAAPEIGSFIVGKPAQGGSDGTLSGITAEMEYSTNGGTSYTPGTSVQLTGIPDGTTYTIRAKATGSAFASKTVAVTVASKEAATITFEPKSAVYTGAAQTHENATANAAGDIAYTYAVKGDSALIAGKPQNAGSYTVTATLDTETRYGTKTVDFTITKKPVTVKADDKSMTAGGPLPVFTVTYAGFVGTENENNALTTPALASCAADGNAAGAFDILLSTPAVLNDTVGKNYTITSQTKGTLTVSSPYSDDDIPPLVTEIKTGGSITGGNLDRLIAGKKDLTVTGAGGAKLVFDTDALRGINDRTSGRISVEIKDVSAEHQDTHKGKTLFSLTVTSGGKTVSDFGGKVTVTLPYTLKDGEKAQDVTVWHLAEDGSLTEIPATYDPKTGLATFTVTHFSKYVVGVNKKWSNPFTDVGEKDWYYDAVKYTHQNGLFSGVTATAFAPADPMTRAMLWTVLARQAGQDMTGGAYEKARAWAVEKGISDGTNPTGNITREQLVTMLWRQAGSPVLMDYPGLSRYTDAGDVSAFARQAMAWAHQKGLVQGSGNALSPKESATRAEVAAIMMRYCRSAAK